MSFDPQMKKSLENILPTILLSGLLGPTPSKVAAELGYSGRTTVSRIMKGNAGPAAISDFCRRIAGRFGLSTDDLMEMDRYFDLTRWFGRLCADCQLGFSEMLVRVVGDDYACLNLSPEKLSELLRLRRDRREDFMAVLSFSFFRQPGSTLEALVGRLLAAFPDNEIGRYVCSNYTTSPIALGRFPARIKDIELGALIIKSFCRDYLDSTRFAWYVPLPDLPERSYWSESDSDCYVLLKRVMVNNNRNAYYEFFHIRKTDGSIENPAQLFFTDNGLAGLHLKDERRTVWANYSAAARRLELQWLNRSVGAEVMERLQPENSQSLRRLDSTLTDERLADAVRVANGIELVARLKVIDVTISRTTLTLHTADGSRFGIDRHARSFLATVGPDMEVMVYRDTGDGLFYAEWPALGERVGLSEFACSRPASKSRKV